VLFDEGIRLLAEACLTQLTNHDQLQLHMFVFDETYRTLQRRGSAISLASWYSQAGTSIAHAAFVSGNEEVVLVDSSARARIFSFITLQFRYGFLHFVGSWCALLIDAW
jgi:hypothetical protein